MKLRDYQQNAVDAVLEAWKTSRACIVVLPTGCGKTVVFSEVIRRRLEELSSSRAMVLAHREELINQAANKIHVMTAHDVGIEMGEFTAERGELLGPDPRVVVSTVQTQITGRIGKFLPEDFSTLVIDEAHHAPAKSYAKCVEHYLLNPDCRLLGVTATPDRADEKALGRVFDTVAYEYSVADAIQDGWLVPIKQKLVSVGSLDFSGISTTAGDFNQGELAEVLEEESVAQSIAVPTVEICRGRRAIVFAASVKQAERLAEIINRYDGGKADWVSGKTPKEERRRKLSDFSEGRISYLVNVGVLTEGFDDAGVEVVVMARPTKSRALYTQMAGRGTRPHSSIAALLGQVQSSSSRMEDFSSERRALIAASPKPECLIVDFVGNSGKHKLMTTVDILGGKYSDEEKEYARRKLKNGDETDTSLLLDEARHVIAERKLVDAEQRAFIKATATYSVTSINPFDIFELAPVDKAARMTNRIKLSYKQQQLLRTKLKIDPNSITPSEGRALLDEFFRRIDRGLATFGQMRYLRKRGYPCPMSFAEAGAIITDLMGGAR